MSKTYLLIGGSRGIGAAVAQHYADHGVKVISVSRSPSVAGEWVQADISTADGVRKVVDAVGDQTVDALLFMGGVWEHNAFMKAFDIRKSDDAETRFVIDVNLIAPIEITKGIIDNLVRSSNPRAIFIGSMSGMENLAGHEVANTASKFGLRGAVQALRLAFEQDGVGFTVINPGNVATDEVLEDIEAGRFDDQVPIPMADLIATVDWILKLSPASEIGDVSLMQK